MKKIGLGIAALVIVVLAGLLATGRLAAFLPGSADTIAIYNGGVIKQQEILQIAQIEPGMDRETAYNVKLAATVQTVKRRLLEIEAAKQKTTPEELLTKLSTDISPVTDAEVNAHLSSQGKDPAKIGKTDREAARKLVQNQKTMLAGEQYLNELFKKGGVRIFIDK